VALWPTALALTARPAGIATASDDEPDQRVSPRRKGMRREAVP
jgi:hypothetical protein